MKNKLSIFFAGLILIFIIQPSKAESVNKPILLDPQTRQIIHNRLCNAYYSNQYTYNEMHNYATNMIEENSNYPRMSAPHLTNNNELDSYVAATYGSINSTFKGLVVDETYHLMIGVIGDKNCR